MPLLEHLVELRQSALLYSVHRPLVIAFLICFYFAKPLYSTFWPTR